MFNIYFKAPHLHPGFSQFTFYLECELSQMKLRLLKQSMVGIGPRTTLCSVWFPWLDSQILLLSLWKQWGFKKTLQWSWWDRMGEKQTNKQTKKLHKCPTCEVVNYLETKITLSWYAIVNLISQYHPVCMTKHSLGSKQLLLTTVLNGVHLVAQSYPLFMTPLTVVCQASLSMGFSRQDYQNGLRFPTPGDLPKPGIELVSLVFPALTGKLFTIEPHGSPCTK